MRQELRLLVFNGTHEPDPEQPYGAGMLSDLGVRVLRPGPRAWIPAKLHRLVHHRWGVQLSQVGFALPWRVDAVLAYLEPNMGFPALGKKIPGSTFRSTALWGIFCWAAEDLTSGSEEQRSAALRLLRACDHVVCFSSNQVPIFTAAGIEAHRVHVVPFGVDTTAVGEQGSSRDIDVLAVGWDRGRDYRTLADAVRGTGRTVELVTKPTTLAGLDPAPEMHLRGTVPFHEYLELLGRSKVVVVPTRTLAYPTGQSVALEAAAAGCAVVVSDTPAMREYFTPGRTALMPPVGDAAALREAIERLLADDDLRGDLVARARPHVRASYDRRHMWEAVARLLKDAGSGVE